MVKTIFLAATSYDLIDIRAEIPHFLKNEYKQNVIYYEDKDFEVQDGMHSHDACIKAVKDCDTLILIIDKRYGGEYSGTKYLEHKGKSITWAEVCYAYYNNIPVRTFVRKITWNERKNYNDYKKKNKDYKSPHKIDNNVFELLNYINNNEHKRDNWIEQFDTILDLKEKIVGKLGLSKTTVKTKESSKKLKDYIRNNDEISLSDLMESKTEKLYNELINFPPLPF
jgi:nucleoside 2-deoxyribosyltransferase